MLDEKDQVGRGISRLVARRWMEEPQIDYIDVHCLTPTAPSVRVFPSFGSQEKNETQPLRHPADYTEGSPAR